MKQILIYLTLVWVLLIPMHSSAQRKTVLRPGEKLAYGAYYNWHFIWIRSGQIHLSLQSKNTQAGERWQISAQAHTFKSYDRLYKVRDTIVTTVKPISLEPEFYMQTFNHGNEHSYYEYRVPAPGKYIYSDVRRFKKPAFKDTLTVVPGIRDMLAMAYEFRSHDYSKLKIGQKVPFTMLVDNEIHSIYYRYLGKETITTRDKVVFSCHKFSILLLQGDFFPGGEYLKVWIEDGPHHLPVMVETKILVGSVKAILESAEINGSPVKFEF